MNFKPVEVVPNSPLSLLSAYLLEIIRYLFEYCVGHVFRPNKLLKFATAFMNTQQNPE